MATTAPLNNGYAADDCRFDAMAKVKRFSDMSRMPSLTQTPLQDEHDFSSASLKDVKDLNDLSWASASTQAPSEHAGSLRAIDFGLCTEDQDEDEEQHGQRQQKQQSQYEDEEPDTTLTQTQVGNSLMELGRPDGCTGGFYGLMRQTRDYRAECSQVLFNSGHCFLPDSIPLEEVLKALQSIPRPDGWLKGDDDNVHALVADSTTFTQARLQYEKNELIRDITFLNDGEEMLLDMLREQHDRQISVADEWVESEMLSWAESIQRATFAMHGALEASCVNGGARASRFKNLITDRDGTTNNYCDRYASSVQSFYNAAWLSEFARRCTDNTVLLTAAPLGGRPDAEGLLELCTMPQGLVTFAGSKGREYWDPSTKQVVEVEPLPAVTSQLLEKLHQRLVALCAQPGNGKFLGLGSGLQRKFGEVTMARNDPASTVSDLESQRFMAEVRCVMHEIDPEGTALAINDTGTDMEIFPRLADGRPCFNKGDGVTSLDRRLGLEVARGPNLICGDTSSDVPMIEAALRLMSEGSDENLGAARSTATLAVLFVITPEQHTRTPKLAGKVRNLCAEAGAHCAILPSPDVLMAALAQFTEEVTANVPVANAL